MSNSQIMMFCIYFEGFVEEIKSHAAPVNFGAPRSASLHDSGHVTASTGRGTSLRERIVEIGKTLEVIQLCCYLFFLLLKK